MDAVTSPSLWSTVAALPDYLLLAQTRQLARHEQALQILVLDHLREIEARRLHLTRGYGSLFDYVVHELGYTAAAAWRRIKAMRLCSQTGAARELLQDGKLNLSNAAQLQNLFERSDRSRGGPSGGHGAVGSLGGAQRSDGTPGEPGPAAPTRTGERDPAPPETGPAPAAGPVLDAAAREEMVRQAAGKSTREVQQMLAEVDPELAQPSDRMRVLGRGRWELKAAIDAECRHGLEKLQMLLSHKDPHLTLGGLVARLVGDGLDRYDPERPRRSRRPVGGSSVDDARTRSKPAQRDAEAVQRSAVRAKRSNVERDHTSLAADRDGTPHTSAPKRHTEAARANTKSAPVRDGGGITDSAAKRHTRAGSGSTMSAAVRGIARRSDSAAKPSDAEQDSTSPAAIPNGRGHTASPATHHGQPGLGGTSHAAARDGSGRAASAAKRQRRADGDGKDVGGALDRATCAGGPRFDADRRNASWAPVPGDRRFPTSAAKRLADAAGLGAVGPPERSPALERHLAALSCFGVPGSRSRYIPVAVKREVWRRDQGCCSYVDRHSGRRCGSRYRLEIDHIVPFALGGGAEPANLRVRCHAHHRLRHAQSHAYAESMPK